MARFWVKDERYGLRVWNVAANTLNKQSRTAEKRRFPSFDVGRGAKTPHCEKQFFFTKCITEIQ